MAKVLGRASQARDWLQTNANWPAKCPLVSSELYEQGVELLCPSCFRVAVTLVGAGASPAAGGRSCRHEVRCGGGTAFPEPLLAALRCAGSTVERPRRHYGTN